MWFVVCRQVNWVNSVTKNNSCNVIPFKKSGTVNISKINMAHLLVYCGVVMNTTPTFCNLEYDRGKGVEELLGCLPEFTLNYYPAVGISISPNFIPTNCSSRTNLYHRCIFKSEACKEWSWKAQNCRICGFQTCLCY